MEGEIIDILITSYYRSEFTWQCLESLKKYTLTPHRVIVVDNGSDQETLDMLWEGKDNGLIDVLVLLDKNYGLEPAKNYGLSFIKSSVFADTDNDILVPPPDHGGDWLSQLRTLLEKEKKLVALSLTPQIFIGAAKEEMFKDSGEVLERDFVGGSMRLMCTAVVRSVGGWRSDPKDMNEANRGEERYICGQLKAKGYKVGYARDLECYHMFGEDGKWGYGDVESYHRDQWPRPTDEGDKSVKEWYDNYEKA